MCNADTQSLASTPYSHQYLDSVYDCWGNPLLFGEQDEPACRGREIFSKLWWCIMSLKSSTFDRAMLSTLNRWEETHQKFTNLQCFEIQFVLGQLINLLTNLNNESGN